MTENTDPKSEILKLMYDRNCTEMDRCRNWHITYLGISTGLYGAIIGGLKLSETIASFSCCEKSFIILLIGYFTIYSIIVIKKQHSRYKEYRTIQRNIQQHWNINEIKNNEERVFPKEWTSEVSNISDYGWFYYASYSFILGLVAILIIYRS